MASACATMLIVATGLVFRKRKRRSGLPMQSLYGTAAAAADALDRVAGMIKKAVYRSSGRRVRGEDDKIPPIKKKVAPDLPLDALRSMDIRVRSVVCTLLCTAERLFAPHRPERVVRTSVGATFRATRGWASAPAPGSPRAK